MSANGSLGKVYLDQYPYREDCLIRLDDDEPQEQDTLVLTKPIEEVT